MGIAKFFRYISERYPCITETLKDYQIPEFDNLYLDVNGIIHGCSHPNDSDTTFRISEETIFKNIFHYIEILFRMIQPQKLFFVAIDGVAPRAKINQQRSRRFRAAKDAQMHEAAAKASGILIPEGKKFDSNCITPGTEFMYKLNDQLKYFITHKISTDKLWQKCKVILSGSQVPGEGEHKIMDYIRYMKSQPDYNPDTRHCLYGLDADLITLGMCTHEVHFTLLREEVKFGKKQTKIQTPEETKFCLFHLSLLREYIDHEFSPLKEKLSFPYDIEKIIDDWILMSFLIGNDFIPHLPNLHIYQGAICILTQVYIDVLPTLDGYINETGTLRLDRFEKFMERLSRFDFIQFAEYSAVLKYLESKTGRRVAESDRPICKKIDNSEEVPSSPKRVQDKEFDTLLRASADMSLGMFDEDEYDGDDSDSEMHNLEFIQHKRDYYMNKLDYENIDEDFLRTQAEGYVRAIQWNLNYYYNGCCSWSWYYPHHYAPYISDIKDFKDLKLEFEFGEPFQPFQQLLAVLSPYSKDLLPPAFHTLLTDEDSPIIDYYPIDFKTDLNGKQQEWEAVVLLPFIDEKRLLDAMAPYYPKLTPEERERNQHGPMCLYSYTEDEMGVQKAPEYFPDIVSHATVQFINYQDIIVPREKLVRGLCPGVKLDVYCPGFPTLRYIEHTWTLEKAKVKVFEKPSFRDNMILHLRPQPEEDLTTVAEELIGKTVFVGWPHLTEAQVVGVSTFSKKLTLINPETNYSPENIRTEELKGPSFAQRYLQKKTIAAVYKGTMGVDIGDTKILVDARPLIGSKYIFGSHGKLYFEKQWSDSQITYAYQMIVKDIATHCFSAATYKTVEEIFVPESVCFMLGHPHYGAMGKVIESEIFKKSGRIRVSVHVSAEPSLEGIKQLHQEVKTQYMQGSIVAQILGISNHLLSRVTGTIYVRPSVPSEFGHEDIKCNIGLNLKFNKKNEEIVGYTRRENNQWLYSYKAVEVLRSYMARSPELFERLAVNVANIITEEELFDKGSGGLTSTMEWLKEQLQGLESRPCGAEALDPSLVKKLEEEIDEYSKIQANNEKLVAMQVKPYLLFKPGLHMCNAPPDSKAQTYLLDRVCCTRDNFTVPLGYKGTVVGIQKAENFLDTMYDVVFDRTFPGGLVVNGCEGFRGYRLSPIDFINISHGERVERDRMKSQLPGPERETSPKIRFIQKKNDTEQEIRLAPPVNAYKWKQCEVQNATVNDLEGYGMIKNAQQNAPLSENAPKTQSTTAKPMLEFQALWTELHKPQKPSAPAKIVVQAPMGLKVKQQMNKSFPESSPQDPSAFLKAVLKISDENPQGTTTQPSAPPKIPSSNTVSPKKNKVLDTPPLVQQLFDHARQNEKVEDEKKANWYCSQLLHYYQLSGIGMPIYSYFTDRETNLIRAHIVLPDKRKFVSEPSATHEQAAGNAAKKVYMTLNLANVIPNLKVLLPPPLCWYSSQQDITWWQKKPPNMPFYHPKLPPPQHFPQSVPKVQPNVGYQQMPNQYRHHPQSKPAQNEPKSEVKNPTSFVPLQAQKKSRNMIAKDGGVSKQANQSAKDNPQSMVQHKKKELPVQKVEPTMVVTEKQKSNQSSSHRQVQNMQNVGKPKKSRVAAKFGIPSQAEETN
ncbi:5'-3' exoribonuclease 1 [Dufourea novaeangliae]|uniref:5'-3' exoribonuclease 1 n=1 Tax=Dufourea novaeangliae TaxID=178035 RepID=A0A154PBK2_DUFNO|nr:5'-3' exoribonuclease 1 [Dufourea novaeangliae]